MTHPTVAAYDSIDGELLVGGVTLTRLTARVGSTPFFAYDRDHITRRVATLREALPSDVHLHYAMKANPMPAVVHHLSGLVDGIDVASALELRVALDTPTKAADISFAGPGKRLEELEQAVASGVLVEVESETEATRLAEVGSRLGLQPRAAVRVNPDFQLKGSGMRMGGGPQQFGVDSERVPDLVRSLVARGIGFEGFHLFAGSQNLDAGLIAEGQRQTVDLVVKLAAETGEAVRYLNLGGGFGIPYTARDAPLDLGQVGDHLHQLMEERIRSELGDAVVVIELGRYLVGESGVYVTRVLDRKVSRGTVFLVVDGGLHHQLAASGNFGQALRRNYPLVLGTRVSEGGAGQPAVTVTDQPLAGTENVTVVGCLCTPLDLLADRVDLPPAQIGDLLVLFQAGAYGLTASPTAFLSHPTPVEVLV